MHAIPISLHHSLILEPEGRKVRLLVMEDGHECVCRREAPGVLRRWMKNPVGHAFAGRLQLWKEESEIYVDVKGEVIGFVPVSEFAQALQETGLA